MTHQIQLLICPECMGNDSRCGRCNGKGSIKVVVPNNDIPSDMAELFTPPKGSGSWLTIAVAIVAILSGAALFGLTLLGMSK